VIFLVGLPGQLLFGVTSMTSGGAAIDVATQVLLEPNASGPPYTSVEINIGTSASFHGASSYQRSIALTGVFGFGADEDAAGTLAAAVSTTAATTITVSDSSAIGTGQILRIDSERMIVTARAMLTTAQTLQTPVGASTAEVIMAVTTGSAYAIGETILLDAERMRILDIAGNNLIVKRAWDGTVLAAHSGSTIYAPRLLTVSRGALGTTAATHLISTAIAKHRPPELVQTLAVGLAIDTEQQEMSGYARFVAQGARGEQRGVGLNAVWDQAFNVFGKQSRTEAI